MALVGTNRRGLTTAMPNGLTNAAPWQTMGNAGTTDPTWSHRYAQDFDTFNTADWTINKVGTGTTALTPFQGGALLVSNTAGATDAIEMQLVNASFQVGTNPVSKACYFKFAGQMSDIANSGFYTGLVQAGATTIASITDGVFISKDTTTTGALTLHIRKASADVNVVLPSPNTLVAATNFELGIVVDSLGNTLAFFNPTTGSNPIFAAAAASTTGASRGAVAVIPAASNQLPTALLTPAFGYINASAATRTLTVDYLVVSNER